jgi:hypothetical protein
MKTKKKRQQDIKIRFDLSINILDLMIGYILSANASVTKKSMVKMRELFYRLDDSSFDEDRQMEVRIFMVKKLLKRFLDDRLTDLDLLAQSILGGQYDEDVLEVYEQLNDFGDLSNDEVHFVDKWVSDRLAHYYLFTCQEEMDDLMIRFKSGDFSDLGEFTDEFRETISGLHGLMRNAQAQSKHANADFSTDFDSLALAVDQTITELKRPSNVLRTGVKELNRMLGPGGFQGGRSYLFLAISGGWKSGMLLNACQWSLRYNQGLTTKDPTKRPGILLVSLENSTGETIERMYSYYVGMDSDLKDADPNEVARAMRLGVPDDDKEGPVLLVKYRPSKSINVADVDAMCDEAELDGIEIVAVVIDYIKRIRSNNPDPELRIELGNAMDDMASLAKARKIPVITASQLNREAFKVIEQMADKKVDMAKQLGMSHIGESTLMIENADFVAVLQRETQASTGKKFLTVKKLKIRGKDTPSSYIAHPMYNDMKLEEDVDLKDSLSLKSIGDGLAGFDPQTQGPGATRVPSPDAPSTGAPRRGNSRLPSINRVPAAPTPTEAVATVPKATEDDIEDYFEAGV